MAERSNPPEPGTPAPPSSSSPKNLRDEFAMAALPALMVTQTELTRTGYGWRQDLAQEAYFIADAMLRARGTR